MTDDQIQALEALYTVSKGKRGSLVDLKRLSLSIKAVTLDELVEQGFIRTVVRVFRAIRGQPSRGASLK